MRWIVSWRKKKSSSLCLFRLRSTSSMLQWLSHLKVWPSQIQAKVSFQKVISIKQMDFNLNSSRWYQRSEKSSVFNHIKYRRWRSTTGPISGGWSPSRTHHGDKGNRYVINFQFWRKINEPPFLSFLDTEIELTEDDDLKKSETNSNVDPNATTTESYSIAGK